MNEPITQNGTLVKLKVCVMGGGADNLQFKFEISMSLLILWYIETQMPKDDFKTMFLNRQKDNSVLKLQNITKI